jgi:K+-sensing histidine kinase KdpD
LSSLASDTDGSSTAPVTLGPADCRDVNRWWTIARSVSNVAHDLRNALQVISGNVEMMQLRRDLDAVTERRLQTIAAQALRAVEAMDPLLAYARPSSSTPHRVDLRVLAEVALSFRSVSLGRAGVTTSGIRSSGTPHFVRLDPSAALQMLLNLFLRVERDVSGRPGAAVTVSVELADDVVVTVIEGTAAGERPQAAAESALADTLSARVVADLAREHGATLQIVQEPDRLRLTLGVPADVDAR